MRRAPTAPGLEEGVQGQTRPQRGGTRTVSCQAPHTERPQERPLVSETSVLRQIPVSPYRQTLHREPPVNLRAKR